MPTSRCTPGREVEDCRERTGDPEGGMKEAQDLSTCPRPRPPSGPRPLRQLPQEVQEVTAILAAGARIAEYFAGQVGLLGR
jgi:hypothetical protein